MTRKEVYWRIYTKSDGPLTIMFEPIGLSRVTYDKKGVKEEIIWTKQHNKGNG